MWTIRQVAEYLNMSPKKVYQLCQNGLEHYRIGGAIRIDEAQLKRFLECRKRKEESGQKPLPSRSRTAKLNYLKL
jgi:excisionase family DNA binding protein